MKTVKVGLLWHSDNNGNLGVGALTGGNIALIERAAERAGVRAQLHLFTPGDDAPTYYPGRFAARHEINGRFTANPSGFLAAARGVDLMLDIGAGDSFTDIYPGKRFAYMVATKLLTFAAGTPLVLSPQTIGPFSRQPHTGVAAWIMNRAKAVFPRDPLSLDAVRAMAPGAHAVRTVDVAFALPYAPQQPAARPRFGLGVSGLLYRGGHTGKSEFGLSVDYRDFMHRLIEAMLARDEADVVLVKHVRSLTRSHEDDGTAADLLRETYPQLVDGPDFTGPEDAKSFISGLDFLTAARMHATIAALSSGVPVVPMSYSRKFEGLYGGLDYQWLLPVKGMTTDQAVAYVLDAWDRRDALRADARAAMARTDALLAPYVEALTAMFQEAAR